MTDVKRCGICRRSLYMAAHAVDGDVCSDCNRAYVEVTQVPRGDVLLSPLTVALWAAKRAWEFADAVTDSTSFTHRPGDPGHSRTPRRPRRK